MTNVENTNTEVSLTPEQIEALLAINPDSDGEATHEEAEIVVTEDTADHVVH